MASEHLRIITKPSFIDLSNSIIRRLIEPGTAARLSPTDTKSWRELTLDIPELRDSKPLLKLRERFCKDVLDDNYISSDDQLLSFYILTFSKLAASRCMVDNEEGSLSLEDKLKFGSPVTWFHEFSRLVPSRFHERLASTCKIDLSTKSKAAAITVSNKADDDEVIPKPPEAKKRKVSVAAKQLAKASKGTQSIMGFFAAKK